MRWLLLIAFLVICVVLAISMILGRDINYSAGRRMFMDSDNNIDSEKEDLSEFKPFNFGENNMRK